MVFCHQSALGLSEFRFTRAKAPSLHGHYPASTLLWASPTPPRAAETVIGSRSASLRRSRAVAAQEVSQVPGLPCADAPPSLPREVPPLLAIIASWRMLASSPLACWPLPSFSVSRPIEVHGCCGSSARLPTLRTQGRPCARMVGFMFDDRFTW